MARILKHGISDEAAHAADVKVQQVVADILEDIRRRGDEAVHELSIRFDDWAPPKFKLSDEQVQEVVATVEPQTIEDLKFCSGADSEFCRDPESGFAGCRGSRPCLALYSATRTSR